MCAAKATPTTPRSRSRAPWFGRLLQTIRGGKSQDAIDMHTPLSGFDEATYLKMNPDVLEAVRKGGFVSGWEHFILFGYGEDRLGVSEEVLAVVRGIRGYCASEAPPPPHLRKRVHGDEDPANFDNVGRVVSFDVYGAIQTAVQFGDEDRILDFGCGCGRVIRHFHKLLGKGRFYGADIDQEAILWCQRHLAEIGEFVANEQSPPLPFDGEFFKFVYSISVFTHLPEDMQFAWLEELRRVTQRGGYLVLTTHGEDVLRTAPEEQRKQLHEAGFYYSRGDGTEGLPDFYQTSFHTPDYIHRQWGKLFEIEKIIPKGINNHQDLILCKRPGA